MFALCYQNLETFLAPTGVQDILQTCWAFRGFVGKGLGFANCQNPWPFSAEGSSIYNQ